VRQLAGWHSLCSPDGRPASTLQCSGALHELGTSRRDLVETDIVSAASASVDFIRGAMPDRAPRSSSHATPTCVLQQVNPAFGPLSQRSKVAIWPGWKYVTRPARIHPRARSGLPPTDTHCPVREHISHLCEAPKLCRSSSLMADSQARAARLYMTSESRASPVAESRRIVF